MHSKTPPSAWSFALIIRKPDYGIGDSKSSDNHPSLRIAEALQLRLRRELRCVAFREVLQSFAELNQLEKA